MVTVDDAIELLRDPANVKRVGGGSGEYLAVKADQVVRLLGARGAASKHEALSLIRQATRALGGDEVVVRRASALHVDKLGSERNTAMPAFWIPAD